jgi:hypothetical protein
MGNPPGDDKWYGVEEGVMVDHLHLFYCRFCLLSLLSQWMNNFESDDEVKDVKVYK